jgi:hypothetical protein
MGAYQVPETRRRGHVFDGPLTQRFLLDDIAKALDCRYGCPDPGEACVRQHFVPSLD